MIDVEDEKREEVINRNKSDESETFFIFLMIDCVINVEDEKREEVIDRNESDESESKENKDKNDITEELSIITETF